MAAGYLYDSWVSNYSSDTVSRIVEGAVVATITVGSGPYGVCVDSNNVVWVSNLNANSISKIVNGIVTDTIMVSAAPQTMCVDRDNNLYITHINRTITKINSSNNAITTITGIDEDTSDICVDKNNAIWVSNLVSGNVQKIVNDEVVATITVGTAPMSICADLNNTIWVANRDSSDVSKIVNDVVTNTISLSTRNPSSICVDTSNVVWVASFNGTPGVGKIVNNVYTFVVSTVTNPYSIWADMSGAIWVTMVNDAKVKKIVSDSVVATLDVGSVPLCKGDQSGVQAAMVLGWGPFEIHYLKDVWVFSPDKGIARICDNILSSSAVTTASPTCICVDRNNVVWAGLGTTSNNVLKIVNGIIVQIISVTGVPYSICVDKDNNIWLGMTQSYNVVKLVNGVVTTTVNCPTTPYFVCCDKNNVIWATTFNGNKVYKIVNGVITSTITLTTDAYLTSICCDQNNVIWVVGRSSKTIMKIVNGVFVSSVSLADVAPQSICCDLNNALWVSGGDGFNKVYKIVDGAVEKSVTVGTHPWSVSVDKDNAIWVMNQVSKTYSKIVNDSVVATVALAATAHPNYSSDSTGMLAAMLFGWNIVQKYLFRKATESNLYKYDTAWTIVGDDPSVQATWNTDGMTEMVTPAQLETLVGPSGTVEILTQMSDGTPTGTTLTAVAVPKTQLIMATGDIDISNAAVIDWIKVNEGVTGNQSIGGLSYAVSKDSGATWWIFGETWVQVASVIESAPTALEILYAGMTQENFNSAPWHEWTLGANPPAYTLRFAYVLDIQTSDEIAYNSKLSYQYDGGGPWEVATPGTQYTAKFISNTQLEVTFLIAGSRAKINY